MKKSLFCLSAAAIITLLTACIIKKNRYIPVDIEINDSESGDVIGVIMTECGAKITFDEIMLSFNSPEGMKPERLYRADGKPLKTPFTVKSTFNILVDFVPDTCVYSPAD